MLTPIGTALPQALQDRGRHILVPPCGVLTHWVNGSKPDAKRVDRSYLRVAASFAVLLTFLARLGPPVCS